MIFYLSNIFSTISILNYSVLICGTDLESEKGYKIINTTLDSTNNLYNMIIENTYTKNIRQISISHSYTEELLDKISDILFFYRKLDNINRSFIQICNDISLRNIKLENVIMDISRSSYTSALKMFFYKRILFFYNTLSNLIDISNIKKSKFVINDIYPILSPRLLRFCKQIYKINLKNQEINYDRIDSEHCKLLDYIFENIKIPDFYTNTFMIKKIRSIIKYAYLLRKFYTIDNLVLLRYCNYKISCIENEVERCFLRMFLINNNFYQRSSKSEKFLKLFVYLKLTFFSRETNKDSCFSDHNLSILLLNKRYKQTYFQKFICLNILSKLKADTIAVYNDRSKEYTEKLFNIYFYFNPYIELEEDYSDFIFIVNCYYQSMRMPLVMMFLIENFIKIYTNI